MTRENVEKLTELQIGPALEALRLAHSTGSADKDADRHLWQDTLAAAGFTTIATAYHEWCLRLMNN